MVEDFPHRSSPASDMLVALSARPFWSDDLIDDEADREPSGDDRASCSAAGVTGAAAGDVVIVSSATSNAPPECERARLT